MSGVSLEHRTVVTDSLLDLVPRCLEHRIHERQSGHDFADPAVEVEQHTEVVLFRRGLLEDLLVDGALVFEGGGIQAGWWMRQDDSVG